MFRNKRIREEKKNNSDQKSLNVPEKLAYTPPLIGVRKNLLRNCRIYSDNMRQELCRDYHLALFKASIKALNGGVVDITTNVPYADYASIPHVGYLYVRDPVLILHDKRLVISTYGNEYYRSQDIIKKVRKITGYQHFSIDNAYFEGGNMFYVPSLKVVLHGLAPGGHYGKKESKKNFLTYKREDYYKFDPSQTNIRLKKALNHHGVNVIGLELHPDVIHYDKSKVREHFYYHLDCFMQVMPDGRLIILNKKILSGYDQIALQNLFGDKFIDLSYPDYLTNPIIFNFIAIPNEDDFTLISPTLPESVLASLSKLGLSLITPESLDPKHERYHKEHAKRVAEILKSEGHVDASATNLATHLAININGYRFKNGKELSFDDIDSLGKKMSCKLDDCYSNQKISFVYGLGGPHCFTTEIIPSKPVRVCNTKKVKQNSCAFFSQKTENVDPPQKAVSMDLRPDF